MTYPILEEPGFRWLFESASDAMLIVERQGGIVAANAVLGAVAGLISATMGAELRKAGVME